MLLILASPVLLAQNDSLSGKKLRQFNELYFKAETNKNLGKTEKARELYEKLKEMDPNNAVIHYHQARVLKESGELQEAISNAEKAHKLDPDNQWYLQYLVNLYDEANLTKEYISARQRLVKLDPEKPDYRLELARAFFRNDQYKDALEQLDELEDIMGVSENVTELKKSIYLQMGDVKNAAKEIRKLIEVNPGNIEYYGSLGKIYSANGFDDKALKVYKQMLEVDSTDPRPHLDLANYYQAQGEFGKSYSHLLTAMQNPRLEIDKKVQVLVNMFNRSGMDSTMKKAAFQILDTVTKLHPESPKIWAVTGDYYSREGQDKKALQALKKTLALDGGEKFQVWEQMLLLEVQNNMYDSLIKDGPEAIATFPNQPLPYLFTGVAYVAKNQHQEAIDYLEQGISYVFGSPRLKEQFYSQLATAHHKVKNYTKSDAYFDKALAVNPENPSTLNNYAYYLSQRGEKLDKALEMSAKSNRLAPENPVFLDTYAWVYYKKGEYEKALDKIEKALSLMQKPDAEVLEHYGDILNKLGRDEEALAQYQKAMEKSGENPELHKKIELLQ